MSKDVVAKLSELNIPTLNEKQAVAILSLATESLYGGSLGSGKSFLLRVAAILYASLLPGAQIYLMRRLNEDISKNHFEGSGSFPELLDPWVRSGYCQIVYSSPREIRFGNGSKIYAVATQYEKDKYKLHGQEITVLLLDEVTHFTQSQYQYFRTRLRMGGLDVDVSKLTEDFNALVHSWGVDYTFTEKQMSRYFPRIIMGTNPGGVSHVYFKEKFVDAAPPFKIWKTPDDEGGLYRQFIPAVYQDNPVLLKNDPDYIKRIRGMGDPELARAMETGDWDILSGGAFSGVWDAAIHFIEPFEIPESWYIDRSFDWGYAKPFSVGWWAESNGDDIITADGSIKSYPPGTVFRIAEYYGCKKGELNKGLEISSYEMGELIATKEIAMGISERVKAGPADSKIFDAAKVRDVYVSPYDEIRSGYNAVYWAEKRTKRGELFIPADKSAGSRIKGLEVLRTMMKNATREPLEGKGFFVFNTCKDFYRTVPTLQRSEKNIEDIDSEGPDHCYDECRYRVLSKRVVPKKLSNFL